MDNPFDEKQELSGGNPFDSSFREPTRKSTAPLIRRSEHENPLITALSAGSRFGKHLVATGQFGLPDRAQEDRDRAIIRQRLHADNLPHPVQGALDFAIDTALDPTTYAGGLVARGIGAGLKEGVRISTPFLESALENSPQIVKDAADVAGAASKKVGDLFHWGGSARRSLTPEEYRTAALESNVHGAREAELTRRLRLRRSGIFDHLSDAQRLDAYRIMNGEIDVSSDPAVNAAAKAGRALLKDAGYLQATASGRARLATRPAVAINDRFKAPEPDEFEQMVPAASSAHRPITKIIANKLPRPKYELPPDLREFKPPAEQGILGPENIRQHYLPGTHTAQTVPDELTRPRPYNLLNPFAAHALERESFKIGETAPDAVKSAVEPFDAAMDRYMRSAATQASAGKLRHALGVLPGQAKPALASLFEQTPRAVGAARTASEKAQDLIRLPADAARSTLTAFGLKHGLVNVPTLAFGSEGARPVGAMFRDAGRLMRMSPEQKWEFNRAAREAGVLGPEYEKENQVLGLLEKAPVFARAGLGGAYGAYEGQKIAQNQGGTPLDRLGGGIAGLGMGAVGGAALPALGKGANNLTWALDEAAKRAVFNAKLRRGMNASEAAMETLKDTIDYSHRTPIAEFLQQSGLAPFATFATKVPTAVARTVARDPRKAVLLDRLTQGLASSGAVDLPQAGYNARGNPKQFSMSTPLSETAELATDPTRYIRAKASDPARAGASLLAELLSRGARGSRYMTYGQPLLPHHGSNGWRSGYIGNALAGYGPLGVGHEALDALDVNEFTPEDAASKILGPLVGGYVR